MYEDGFKKDDTIESPTFLKKKKKLEDFLKGTYDDTNDFFNYNGRNKGSSERYRNNHKNCESQRVIRVRKVSIGRHQMDSINNSMRNRSIGSSQRSLKGSHYADSVSAFSNKSLVDLFKERD